MIYIFIGLLLFMFILFWREITPKTVKELDMMFDIYYKPESFHWQTREETYAAWRKKHKKVYASNGEK